MFCQSSLLVIERMGTEFVLLDNGQKLAKGLHPIIIVIKRNHEEAVAKCLVSLSCIVLKPILLPKGYRGLPTRIPQSTLWVSAGFLPQIQSLPVFFSNRSIVGLGRAFCLFCIAISLKDSFFSKVIPSGGGFFASLPPGIPVEKKGFSMTLAIYIMIHFIVGSSYN